ncbi:sensor domain-containing phosphodiesterase [Marinomonas balearica]|uniref:EAL domain-containing protein (Putative c-di-GMP-specific phosphodiesterase class I) n=1 Tax=Marinomonas balearica TaxID=491947 RepID=A0A4R6MB69_9GAMM|nr:EAL domain-containing protein [Marinomonas balearica]TDO98837.1 EAL domain-containing protein (putative c-di-GMP-specific phosphodiesterase class I) [Marinomonas balearica]
MKTGLQIKADLLQQITHSDEVTFSDSTLYKLLETVRCELSMEVAFIAQFEGNERIILKLAKSPDCSAPIYEGFSAQREKSYCQKIADGELPNIIQNTASHPIAKSLIATKVLSIKSYIGIPLYLSNGELFGSFCCFSSQENPNLAEQHVSILSICTQFIVGALERQIQQDALCVKIAGHIDQLEVDGLHQMVFQPITDTVRQKVVGVEALSRFGSSNERSTQEWFDQATFAGVNEKLELRALQQAISILDKLPDDVYLSVNLSSCTLQNPSFWSVIESIPLSQLKFEINANIPIDAVEVVATDIFKLKQRGARVALDDVGIGHNYFKLIQATQPDSVKLKRSLMCCINDDLARKTLVSALVSFASELSIVVTAKGVETKEELLTLMELGIYCIQGFYYAKPLSLNDLTKMLK